MAASRGDLKRWFEEGVEEGATHMIIICDTFDYEDYPMYVMPGDDFWEVYKKKVTKADMQDCMEVYDLKKCWPSQASGRVQNAPAR